MLRLLAFFLLLVPVAVAAQTPFASDRIAVEVHGTGPDVVLIPGLSSSPRIWDDTIAAVPGYRYHVIHVSGFAGRPAGANATGPVLIPVAEEIARYIREAGLRRPAIVGHSMGGSWALLVGGRHPELAGKVMVVDMLPFIGAMFGGPSATAESLAPVAGQIRDAMASATGEARQARAAATIAAMTRTESARPALLAQSLASDPAVSGQGFYDLIVTDLRPEVAAITGPLMVLYTDPAGAPVTPEQVDGFYRLSYEGAQHGEIHRVPETSHFIMIDQADAFRAVLRVFLAR